MAAPRLNVGILFDGYVEFDEISARLEGVGHKVTPFDDHREAGRYDLVVLAMGDDELDLEANKLAAFVRKGQIYLHISVVHGLQVLDALETEGAIVCAAYPVSEDFWVIGAADELGESIVEVLVGEMGGTSKVIDDSLRPRLKAALTYRSFEETLRQDSFRLFNQVLGDEDRAAELSGVGRDKATLTFIGGPAGMAAQLAAIEEPGVKRAFRDLTRRSAELAAETGETGNPWISGVDWVHDLEFWAMGDN